MRKWQKIHEDLGEAEQNVKLVFTYKYLGDVSDIKDIVPGCGGCTKVLKIGEDGTVIVQFSTGTIPKHLKASKDNLDFSKKLTVKYIDGTTSLLTFSGVLIND